MARFNPLSQTLEVPAPANAATARPRRPRAASDKPKPAPEPAKGPTAGTAPKSTNVREVPLATFAAMLGSADLGAAEIAREEFARYFDRVPAGIDWRQAWRAFRGIAALEVKPPEEIASRVTQSINPALAHARAFLLSL